MDAGKFKNMVVLKDLPSNLIDEAIIILKPNKTIKHMDYIKNKEKTSDSASQYRYNSKDYIINEANMVISDYISSLEKQKDIKYKNIKKIENKYKRLKTCTFVLIGLIIINMLFNFI